MKKIQIGSSALLLFSTAALAGPSVTGNIISWPDDGWYQVLNKADYAQVCGGGTSCEVSPGTYIVINHTTDERFENVLIGEDSTEIPEQISVSGNIISWPDDGWYQVQDQQNYTAMCSGGLSCEVPDGTYILINHTTGERFENIIVAGTGGGSGVTVSGNIISWPDDGWYQVQNESDYSQICSGGLSCTVIPGRSYIVINHTTGERTEGITVEGDEIPPGFNFRDVEPEEFLSFADSIVRGKLLEDFFDWAEDWVLIQSITDFSTGQNTIHMPLIPEFSQQVIATEETFNCLDSGTVTLSHVDRTPIYNNWNYSSTLNFDSCEAGDMLLSGELDRDYTYTSGADVQLSTTLGFNNLSLTIEGTQVTIENGSATLTHIVNNEVRFNCSAAKSSTFEFDIDKILISGYSITDSHYAATRLSALKPDVTTPQSGDAGCSTDVLQASGEATITLSMAPIQNLWVSTEVNARRSTWQSTPSTVSSGTGKTSVVIADSEQLIGTMVSPLLNSVQIDITSAGSTTSDTGAYDFFSGTTLNSGLVE